MLPDEKDIDSIDIDFFELFEVLDAKEIIKLLNAIGGKFTISEGTTIKKLIKFLSYLDEDQIDNLMLAFDEIMEGK